MKKVLIISYFFPPANFVGGERTAAWFKYLQEEGFYPIIVTRCWNDGQSDVIGKVENNQYSMEQTGNGEIHRVPVLSDARNTKSGIFRKILTYIRLHSRNVDLPVHEYKTIYDKCIDLMRENTDITAVIASGRPFESFQIGYLLKKEFNITWIPDYRDEWNTHLARVNESLLWRKIHKKERTFEKVWTSNADHFLSVSPAWVKRIGDFIQKDGSVIMNGYDQLIEQPEEKNISTTELHLLYAGSLYSTQNIELLIRSVEKLQKEGKRIRMTFIGTEMMPDQQERLASLTKGMKDIAFEKRLLKAELHQYQQKADVLVMTAFENVNGWLPVKMFDYYASGKPILVCPSDHDVINDFIEKTNSGVCINDPETLENQLNDWCELKEKGQFIHFERNFEAGKFYSRKEQTKKLAELLNSIKMK